MNLSPELRGKYQDAATNFRASAAVARTRLARCDVRTLAEYKGLEAHADYEELAATIFEQLVAGETLALNNLVSSPAQDAPTPFPTRRLPNPRTIELCGLDHPATCQACHRRPAIGTLIYPMIGEPYLVHICSPCLPEAVGNAE